MKDQKKWIVPLQSCAWDDDIAGLLDGLRKPVGGVEIGGRLFPVWQSAFSPIPSPVYVSDNMSGKMQMIPAISTSPVLNQYCVTRQNGTSDDCICKHCFAMATVERYTNLGKHLQLNSLLMQQEIPADVMPVFVNAGIVRLESFGDVASVQHAINLLNIANATPTARFALWSKNWNLVQKAVNRVGKPRNVTLVASAPMLDTPRALCHADIFMRHRFGKLCPSTSIRPIDDITIPLPRALQLSLSQVLFYVPAPCSWLDGWLANPS